MKKSLIIALILLLPSNLSFAQVRLGNEQARPSAEAWQMTRYGDAAPSLYTGTMALSVPVYTYKDPDFEIPISLDYSSNGCVPNVRAGVLGPDWSLNAGGVITREIRGFPDEQIYHYTGQFVYHDNPMEIMPYDLTFYGYWWEHAGAAQISNSSHIAYMSPDMGIVDNCPLSTVRLLAGVSCIADHPIEATISTPDASILRGFGDFTLFDYEPFVGLTRVIEPDGKETVYNYNESGKLSSVNDAGNKKTAGYLYSPDNRLTE